MKGPGGRSGLVPAAGIHRMENHDEAYRIWSRMEVRHRVLVHSAPRSWSLRIPTPIGAGERLRRAGRIGQKLKHAVNDL